MNLWGKWAMLVYANYGDGKNDRLVYFILVQDVCIVKKNMLSLEDTDRSNQSTGRLY